MLDQDKEMLKQILINYPAVEVVSELVFLCRDHGDELSDLGLKERAKDYAEAASLMSQIRDVMLDAE